MVGLGFYSYKVHLMHPNMSTSHLLAYTETSLLETNCTSDIDKLTIGITNKTELHGIAL